MEIKSLKRVEISKEEFCKNFGGEPTKEECEAERQKWMPAQILKSQPLLVTSVRDLAIEIAIEILNKRNFVP